MLIRAACGLVIVLALLARLTAMPVRATAEAPREPPCPLGSIAARDADPPPEDWPVAAPRKQAWEEALGGREAARPYVRARLRGWPEQVLVDRRTLPAGNREFLERVARDTWRGLDALTDRENGLPVDHVRLGETADGADADVGDYTNVTNVGLHLIAVVAARELGLLSAAEAVERVRRLLDTLGRLETHEGFFFNYYDTTSLERTSNFLSFIDSAWLTAGLMVVRASFPSLREQASQFIQRMNYGFFYDPGRGQMSHGYYVNRRSRSRYHYGVLYTEARLASLIAIGKGDVPEDLWFDMVRTYPASCAGQTSVPQATQLKTVRSHVFSAGYYEWQGVRFVPSWGGSMFEALMPSLVLDEQRFAPKSLGINDRVHAAVQRRYATEALGYPVWGVSPAATPLGNGYREYGVSVLGARGYRDGVVTPHAGALALLVTPDAALANLRRLAELYDLYGPYGFYDAVDPSSGLVARTYLTLDQSMVFIALANVLKDHCIQTRFASDRIVQQALPMLRDEDFFD